MKVSCDQEGLRDKAIHIAVYVTDAPTVVECSGQTEHPVQCYKRGSCLAE